MELVAAFFTIIVLVAGGLLLFTYTPKGKRWLKNL